MLTLSGRSLCTSGVALLCALLLLGVPARSETPLEVTGRPASATFLGDLLGTRVTAPLPPGGQAVLGGRAVRNLEIPELPVEALSFSDHPERVRSRGLLFQGGLLALKPIRLQYYHEGGREDGPLYLSVRVKNRGGVPARLHAVVGAAGPDPDYFTAGHQNNMRFLERLSRNEGVVRELAPGETWQVDLHEMPLNQVVSGTVQMTLLEGTQVDYGLFAVHGRDEPIGFDLLSNPKDVHARGVYPAADQTLLRGWTVGEAEGYAALGAVRQPNVLPGPELKGDYGVVYRIRLALRNPEDRPARVQVLFNPRGGAATGTFLVRDEDGSTRTWDVPGPVKAFERVPLGEIELPARSRRVVEIWTMPEGASNYPVRLVLRDAGVR